MREPSFARLGAFWFGAQAVWGAVLGLSLQARTSELGGPHALALYGTIATLGAVVAAITQIATGPFADAVRARGRSRTGFLAWGTLVAAIALWDFYTSRTFGGEMAAFLMLQVGMNVATGPYQTIIPDYVQERRAGSASSWMAALQSAGNATGALIAAFVSDARAAGVLLAALLTASAAASATHVRNLTLAPVLRSRFRVTRAFVDLFASRAFIFVGFYTLLGYLYFYVARSLGMAAPHAVRTNGIALLVFTAAGALGAAAAGRIADRIDRRTVASAGCAVTVAALVALALAPRVEVFFIAATVAGFAWGAFLTADWALACSIVPRDALATAFGVWNLALLAPQVLAPALTTLVLGLLGAAGGGGLGPRIALGLAAVEFAAGAFWLWRLPAGRPV